MVKGKRTVLRHAFIAIMPNGHIGVFERVGTQHKTVMGKKGKKIQSGLPIIELFGPSIPSALSNPVVERAIVKKIREKFPEILKHEIEFMTLKS